MAISATAKQWANRVFECSLMPIRFHKKTAYAGFEANSLQEAIGTPYLSMRALFQSEDFIEGPLAFAEK